MLLNHVSLQPRECHELIPRKGPNSKTQPFVQLRQKNDCEGSVELRRAHLENLQILSNLFEMKLGRVQLLGESIRRADGVGDVDLLGVGGNFSINNVDLETTTTPSEATSFALTS